MLRSFKLSTVAACAAVLLALVAAQPARAVLVQFETNHPPNPGVPPGNSNVSKFTGQLTGSGASTITGVTPITGQVFGNAFRLEPNQQVTPLSLSPATVNFTTGPKSVGDADSKGVFGTNKSNLEITVPGNGSHIIGAQEVDVDLLNGQSVPFALNTIPLTIVNVIISGGQTFEFPGQLNIDVSAVLKQLWTEQNGLATFVPTGQGTGTFAMPSTIHGVLDAHIALNKANVFDLKDTKLNEDLLVTGNYTVDPIAGTPGLARVTLTGGTNLSLPLSLATAFATDLGIAALTGTVSLLASINVGLSFQLQDVVIVPEPGAVILLGVGLAAALPYLRHRWRRLR